MSYRKYLMPSDISPAEAFKATEVPNTPLARPEREKDEWIEAWVSGYPAIQHHRCNTFIYAPNGKKGYNYCPNCGWPMKGDAE